MNYCDLHCDTPFELCFRKQKLADGDLNINLEKVKNYDKYLQLAAYCAWKKEDDEKQYKKFLKVVDYFEKEVEENGCAICRSADEIKKNVGRVPSFVLTVEDSRITAGKIERVDELVDIGVRVMTLMWGGETCIGGSHESAAGLTDFGKDVTHRMAELGIIPDVSHASRQTTKDILEITKSHGRPVIATHSCAFALREHTRNLTDGEIRAIAETGGIIGINSFPPFLTNGKATLADAVRHIKYIFDLAGENSVAIGCDFDGMGPNVTKGLEDASKMPNLDAELEKAGFTSAQREKILFSNAYEFLINNIA
ncbi:MAG: membrane dipeptidase [Clostridia bacterium]|nr:membrane dipeptidase [Clostridia bacterium]